ncbi:hypothetical protein MGG_16150 [Pyricularia oryzae 70-15]|uniref:Uncharacterized protein n=5 Tax=Pyricularia TaxID=48558 RepID=A0ABQ8NU23_PYRGI|nr:uncharacterized protein MGG_16150 [Pyricularia oryzae 70-15]ELQ38633.1 hypothetical protein OOU_Y34scaffold00533g17 [Pyricularia oryzae Y34]KAI6258597.1 hypothetical protein MCOR19_005054 [Pyricularia oryzae]KAI6302123.1 hypothetical protein MCOR33_002440 [Pyricularia grisea]EHA56751.1 hypothetical protein MGG_16150 [Pyricularia oryzae 70-15]KAI6269291.1 hypothetical protein MCOR26_008793 [Pyricularia oryzae]
MTSWYRRFQKPQFSRLRLRQPTQSASCSGCPAFLVPKQQAPIGMDGNLRWRFELQANGTFPESHRITDYISPAE